MTLRRYLQIDVFASKPGTGNPLGVILDSDDLEAGDMQAIAAWLNLSETIFFVPTTEASASYHVRIFTPRIELPFAGHPSVGAAWVATKFGITDPQASKLVQQCGAGLLPVTIEGETYAVRGPQAKHVAAKRPVLPEDLAEILAPGFVPEQLNNGPDWWLLQARDEASLRALQPDLSAIASQLPGGKVTLFAFSDSANYQLVVRAFAPSAGVPEDPVTGSANALIGAYLHQHASLPANPYISSQGRELGRDGKVQLYIDSDGEVWIGGQVQPVIEGTLRW